MKIPKGFEPMPWEGMTIEHWEHYKNRPIVTVTYLNESEIKNGIFHVGFTLTNVQGCYGVCPCKSKATAVRMAKAIARNMKDPLLLWEVDHIPKHVKEYIKDLVKTRPNLIKE